MSDNVWYELCVCVVRCVCVCVVRCVCVCVVERRQIMVNSGLST